MLWVEDLFDCVRLTEPNQSSSSHNMVRLRIGWEHPQEEIEAIECNNYSWSGEKTLTIDVVSSSSTASS